MICPVTFLFFKIFDTKLPVLLLISILSMTSLSYFLGWFSNSIAGKSYWYLYMWQNYLRKKFNSKRIDKI